VLSPTLQYIRLVGVECSTVFTANGGSVHITWTIGLLQVVIETLESFLSAASWSSSAKSFHQMFFIWRSLL